MSIGTRAATCAQCSKRLSRKSWYYRNGKYYCKRRCWVTEGEKAATEAAKAEKENQEKQEKENKEKAEAKPEPVKETPAAS